MVGSSNFTLAGFNGNTELNVRVTGDGEMQALGDWFDALWSDSEDIGNALVTELERSWALAKTPPYHVYLKALYELYYTDVRRRRATAAAAPGHAAGQLPARRGEPRPGHARGPRGLLYRRRGRPRQDVHRRGAAPSASRELPQRRPSAYLCPAGLKPMWERFNEDFQPRGRGRVAQRHPLGVRAEFDEELGRYVDVEPTERGLVLQREYSNRGPVLVDEAHNFRNFNQRSKGLRDYLDAGITR